MVSGNYILCIYAIANSGSSNLKKKLLKIDTTLLKAEYLCTHY